jgi:hypothetical protein
MRNRKSRNRRGGGLFGLCLNCSPEKKAFKEARDTDETTVCKHISSILQKSSDGIKNIQPLFDQLSDTPIMSHGWTTGNNDRGILINCIANMVIKKEITDTDIESFDKILKDAININIAKKNEKVKLMRDRRPMEGPGFHTPSIYYTQQNAQPQDAGKSRRRHRRGRTLHKRRKSRKVRKTRCRRM